MFSQEEITKMNAARLKRTIERTDELITEGAQKRYGERITKFVKKYGPVRGRLIHLSHWLIHNCLVHPWLGIYPWTNSATTFDLHTLSSRWLALGGWGEIEKLPELENLNRFAWFVHNVPSHFLIGVLPCGITFRWHDKTAKAMNVPGWL